MTHGANGPVIRYVTSASGVAKGGDGGSSPRAALLGGGAAKFHLYLKIWKGENILRVKKLFTEGHIY